MKKSMLVVINLALTLINLVLTVFLVFTLVGTNTKTNNLIEKIAKIVDLDVGGGLSDDGGSGDNISDITYVDVKSDGDSKIIVSFVDNGKSHQAVLSVSIGLNSKASDYNDVSSALDNGMKYVTNLVTNEAGKYQYSTINANKTAMEEAILAELKKSFKTECIKSVFISIVIQ